jgi:hypothetical protein
MALEIRAADFNSEYPATLDSSEQPHGYEWTCDAGDVWRIQRLALSQGDEFRVEIQSAQVVFGRHGTNALWAAVFPDQPGTLTRANPGQGERVTSLWLRFHPARVGELFPTDTVVDRGDPANVGPARRMAAHKLRSCWQAGGLPMVPTKESVTVDLETSEGPRRFYSIDTTQGTVQYADDFRTRPLPVAKPIESESAIEVFDAIWNAFDEEYAMFSVKPRVDWAGLRDKYRPLAAIAKTNHALAELLAELLSELEDLHVYVQVDGFYLPGYTRNRPLNASRNALNTLVGPLEGAGKDLSWAITTDEIGYVAIDRLADPELPECSIVCFRSWMRRAG